MCAQAKVGMGLWPCALRACMALPMLVLAAVMDVLQTCVLHMVGGPSPNPMEWLLMS